MGIRPYVFVGKSGKDSMGIYLKFNDINYKAPNKLIIGRGLPFESEDHSFSRDHALIVKNAKGLFLNEKNKNLKQIINGKEIIDCKYHHLAPGMSFVLGESQFEVLDSEPSLFVCCHE